MRDSVSFWVFDDRGELGLPRVGIEALARSGTARHPGEHRVRGRARLSDCATTCTSRPVEGPDGRPAVLGAGPLSFECVEPFDVVALTFDGQAVADVIGRSGRGPQGRAAGRRLRFEVEATIAVPPWVQGALQADADVATGDVGRGRPDGRPPLRAAVPGDGLAHVGGEEHTFTGSGLRIRRQGVRRLEGFWGHCWQSALFPSGRAFGYIAYPPRPDGEPTFNEGYLFSGDGGTDPRAGRRGTVAARLQPLGEDVSVVLETADGTETIEGETVLSTHDITDPSDIPPEHWPKMANWTFPALQQAGVRYRWDGERRSACSNARSRRTSSRARATELVIRHQLVGALQVGLQAVHVVAE